MIQSCIKVFLFVSTLSFFSCGQNKWATSDKLDSGTSNVILDNDTTDDTSWLSPKSLTAFSFLEMMRKKGTVADKLGVILMTDSFPDNWLKREDIDSLMKIVNSKEKCNCFLNPLSSYIPYDSADIGGYAVAMVSSFRQKKKVSFGLYACPKTNKKDVKE